MWDERLGEELVEAKLLTPAQLQTVLDYQKSLSGRLTDIVLKLGFVDEESLNAFIADRERMHTVKLDGRIIDVDLMGKIPRWVIERHCVIPFRQTEDTILLAMSEPSDYQAVEEIQFLTNCRIETGLAPRSQMREMINRFYAENPHPAATVPPTPIDLQESLLSRISDPVVAALARALFRRGVLSAEVWQQELDRSS